MATSPQLFMWSNDFATDIPIIDEQHKHLIGMINDVVKLSLEGSCVDVDDLKELRQNLADYVVYHFGTEEEIMSKRGIDPRHAEKHTFDHEGFKLYVSSYFDNKTKLCQTELREFANYLIRWLAYHILNQDMSLARQLAAISEGKAPIAAFDQDSATQETNTEPLLKALQGLFYIISEKNLQLERANEELEKKVHERTKELEKANAKLSILAIEDELTKLPNRRFAMGTLDRLMKEWERYQTPFAVIMIDADRFKAVNDEFGHDFGDKVLQWIARFLMANTRKSDVVARLGGDEFLVICPHGTVEEARKLAEVLRSKAAAVNEREPLPYWTVSLSLGISAPSGKIKSVKTVLTHADKAMYADKARTRTVRK